ncbi:uncharacterized protein TNCV_1425721 [Trichonephila clavipes]|nr:uncharacterized protein TNCV_1425721 [Trichonephila clavipes]
MTWSVAKSPRVAEKCDVNIQSINQSIRTRRLKELMHVKFSKAQSRHIDAVWRFGAWGTNSDVILFSLPRFKGKKELIEWCMKEGLIASSYECPKCNDRHDMTWSVIKRFLRNRTSHAECMFDHYLAE